MSILSVVCPNCGEQFQLELGDGRQPYTCSGCEKPSTAFVAKVRAKRSRGDKRIGTRDYSIRLLHSGIEDFIEFSGPYGEFEMRAGDWVLFGYDETNRLAILQNLTLRSYMSFPKPTKIGCLPVVLGFIILIAIVLVATALFGGRH